MQISDFCKEYKVAYLEVISLMSFERETFGSVDDLPYKGLYQGLLGDTNATKNLIEWLGDDGFKSHKQGELNAITFLYDQKLICIFYIYRRYFHHSAFHWRKDLWRQKAFKTGVSNFAVAQN